MMPKFTKKVLYNLLYTARSKSKQIYIALGRDPADLNPVVTPGAQKQYIFTYLLETITSDDKTTKDDLVEALESRAVGHGKLANDLKADKTIEDGSKLTGHLDYLTGKLKDTIGKVAELADQLEVDLSPGTVQQAKAFDLMLTEITVNKVITPADLVVALRSPTVGEGVLAGKIAEKYGVVEDDDLVKRYEALKSHGEGKAKDDEESHLIESLPDVPDKKPNDKSKAAGKSKVGPLSA